MAWLCDGGHPDARTYAYEVQGAKAFEDMPRSNVPGALSGTSRTLLMAAANEGRIEVTETLLRFKADLELRDDQGYTALAYAATMGSLRGGHTSGPYGKLLLLAKQEAGLLTSDWERQRAREFREQADGCVAVVERLLQARARIDSPDVLGMLSTALEQAEALKGCRAGKELPPRALAGVIDATLRRTLLLLRRPKARGRAAPAKEAAKLMLGPTAAEVAAAEAAATELLAAEMG